MIGNEGALRHLTRRCVCAAMAGALTLQYSVYSAGAQTSAVRPLPQPWQSTQFTDHPLVGVIWSAHDRRRLNEKDLSHKLTAQAMLLLGEVHDNPDHHRIQAWAIQIMAAHRAAAGQTPPAVVFEHIRADQAAALREVLARPAGADTPITPAALFDALSWQSSGWPAAQIFEPLFAAVLARRLPMLAGDPPRGRTREIARGGLSAIAEDERQRLGLATAMPQPLADALANELKGSHCGMLPDRAIPGMALAQRYRDAHLADALIAARQQHGAAILVAGNGHVRTDRGAAFALRQRAPDTRVVALTPFEVEDGKTDPQAYAPHDPAGAPATDFVIFTPRAERPDPCRDFPRPPAKKT